VGKILITGNLGYIGSVLTNILIEKKFDVVGLDIGFFKDCLLSEEVELKNQIIKDILNVDKSDLKDIEVIIHLAALSNDPLGELNPKLTSKINFEGTVKLAQLAKQFGVRRFVYISTLSIYGISTLSEELDEYNSKKNPITVYAKTKYEAEIELFKMVDKNFEIVSLRPSTVFGASPRLRCDIVFNNLLASAFTTKKIIIKSDGSPWRPVVHVRDLCSAIIAAIQAPKELISGKSFNVGIDNGNYTVKHMANIVKEIMPRSEIIFNKNFLADERTYKISFKRILSDLKEFYKPEWSLEKGGNELIEFFKKINFSKEDFIGYKTNRIKKLKNIFNK